ncbi:hypothetical protein VNI00_009279 [Paramarasmius palmivorus]|uniref:Uncharacterized protein n=1 Tax=Paramarasmius palmivorus TaxID=297713 RepID=A0AAW0CRQ0_9AGAR
MPDLGASILDLAGASVNEYALDGIMFLESTDTKGPTHTLVEYWHGGIEEGIYASLDLIPNTTYRSIRVDNWVYGVWCTGEKELYDISSPHSDSPPWDIQTDPYQLVNLASSTSNNTQVDTTRIISRLDALLIVLKTCIGDICSKPWSAIFSSGEAASLEDALNEEYDAYFNALPKFGYLECQYGYFEDGVSEYPRWNASMGYN